MSNNQPAPTLHTYGNWRRPASAGILGLGLVGTIILFAGLLVAIGVVFLGGLIPGVVVFGVLALGLWAMVSKDRHHRSLITRTTERFTWWNSRSKGANLLRNGPTGRTDWGTFQLPGLAATTELHEYQDGWGRPFAMIYHPTTGDYTVVISAEPDGAALVDQEQIDNWVADWGHWLANLGDAAGIVAASVTIETAPDTGSRLRREVELNVDHESPAFARSVLNQIVADYPTGSATVRAYVAVTFSAVTRLGGRRRSTDDMGRDLATSLPGLTEGLSSTGAGAARPLDAEGLCEVIRIAYDPAVSALIDDQHAAGESTNLTWSQVGPSGAQANWDSYRHDSALSVTWQMSEAPRGIVQSNILSRFLAPHRDIARKRITWLYRPIDPARAAVLVETDLRAATFNVGSTDRPSARAILSTRAALATAAEEASGAGLINFGMVATATVTDVSREADARAAMENLGAAARLRLRVVAGGQDTAFAAALPLGLVLPKHLKLPTEMRSTR